MYNSKDADEKARVEKVVYDMVDRALDMEGSCTVIPFTLETSPEQMLTSDRVSTALA